MRLLKLILIVKLIFIAAALSVPQVARGTDIPITPTGAVFKFQTTPVWGQSGPGGFNNNFFFTPINVNESVCVYVYNNNPTNAHTYIASITVTANPSNTTPSDGTWQTVAFSNILVSPISPGIPSGVGGQVSGVAQVNVGFSGSSVLGGAPDTATVSIVQTTGNCAPGNNFFNNAPLAVSAVLPLQVASEGLGQAFAVPSQTVTNPAGTVTVIHLNTNNRTKSIFYDKLILLCSANCSMSIIGTTGLGGTCVGLTNSNLKINATLSTATVEGTCTTDPTSTGTIIGPFTFPANTPTTIDLRGLIAPAGTPTGVALIMSAALTGTVNASFFWYEK